MIKKYAPAWYDRPLTRDELVFVIQSSLGMVACAVPGTFERLQTMYGPSAMWITVPAWAVAADATLNGVLLEQVSSQVVGTALGSLSGMGVAVAVTYITITWVRQVIVHGACANIHCAM